MATEEEEKSISQLESLSKYYKAKYLRLVNDRRIVFKFLLRGDLFDLHRPSSNIKWRGEAHSYYLRRRPPPGYGIAERVYDIACCFMPPPHPHRKYSELLVKDYEEEGEYNLEWREALLDELLVYDILCIDVASVLHSKGCLFSFLGLLLSNNHACIRAKAADVISTMVQSNLTNQRLLIKGNVLKLILHNFNSYLDDATSRIKTLAAISALIEENEYGMTVFRRENGYAALRNALISESVCPTSTIYYNLLNLIDSLLLAYDLYHYQVPCMYLASDDSEVLEIALSTLLLIEGRTGGNSRRLVRKHMINRSKSCLRISHLLLFPLFKKKRKEAIHCSKNKNRNRKANHCSKKQYKLH